jgi:hypothetical protein
VSIETETTQDGTAKLCGLDDHAIWELMNLGKARSETL